MSTLNSAHLWRIFYLEAGKPGLHGLGRLISGEDPAPGPREGAGDVVELSLLLLRQVGVDRDRVHGLCCVMTFILRRGL